MPEQIIDKTGNELLINADGSINVGSTGSSSSVTDTDAKATATLIPRFSRGYVFNGTTWDRARSASAANASATTQIGVAQAALPGNWSVVHAPAANTQATASKAAGAAGVRHVCTAISAALYSGSTAVTVPATPVTVVVRDGATGAGTIIWQEGISVPTTAGGCAAINLSGLSLVGSAATAMTIEFSAAGGAGSFETVSMQGYSVA